MYGHLVLYYVYHCATTCQKPRVILTASDRNAEQRERDDARRCSLGVSELLKRRPS